MPSSWHFVRQRGMKTDVLAKGVGCYDVSEDGSIVYTNGGAISPFARLQENEGLRGAVHFAGVRGR